MSWLGVNRYQTVGPLPTQSGSSAAVVASVVLMASVKGKGSVTTMAVSKSSLGGGAAMIGTVPNPMRRLAINANCILQGWYFLRISLPPILKRYLLPPLNWTTLTTLSLSQFAVPQPDVKIFALTCPDPKGPFSPAIVALHGTEGGEQRRPWEKAP